MVELEYDVASSMSRCVNGVQTKIRETALLATYVHCSSHLLNRVLNAACSVLEIRNMFATVILLTNHLVSLP